MIGYIFIGVFIIFSIFIGGFLLGYAFGSHDKILKELRCKND